MVLFYSLKNYNRGNTRPVMCTHYNYLKSVEYVCVHNVLGMQYKLLNKSSHFCVPFSFSSLMAKLCAFQCCCYNIDYLFTAEKQTGSATVYQVLFFRTKTNNVLITFRAIHTASTHHFFQPRPKVKAGALH